VLCIATALIPAGIAGAAAGEDGLVPFSARYLVRVSALPFPGHAERSLERIDGHWRFRSRVKAPLLSLTQETLLDAGPELRAREYRQRQGGLLGGRERRVTFDRAAGLVRRSGDKTREHPLVEPAWDPLGWQLALQRDLKQDHPVPAERYHYRVSDGGDYEHYSFAPREREAVTVPAGTFEALRLERDPVPAGEEETRLWLDPARGYRLLRMDLVDEDGRTLTVTLETAPAGAAAGP